MLHQRPREKMEGSGLNFLLDAVDRFPLREEFANNIEQPDPVPMAFLPNNEAGLAVHEDSNAGSGCAKQLGGDGTGREGVSVHRRRDASPTRSAQSTDRVILEAPRWTKRPTPKPSHSCAVNFQL